MRLIQGEKFNGTNERFIAVKMDITYQVSVIMAGITGILLASAFWLSSFWFILGTLFSLTFTILTIQTHQKLTRHLHRTHTRSTPHAHQRHPQEPA